FFIETILDETVEEVHFKPQEYTINTDSTDEEKLIAITIFRLDFIATIKTSDGEFKKVLIEIQKARHLIDLMRFRNYLAEQYKKEDEVVVDGKLQKMILPIKTIYLLGFNLPEIDSPAIKVN